MRSYTFHWEIRTIIAQFEDAFNDIVIKRYNYDKEPEDRIHVNFRFSPKTRVLHDLVNKNQHLKIPIVAVVPASIRRDPERVFNKIEGSWHTNTGAITAWRHLLQPVPVNITMNMSILGRFQMDVDQILTNFIPYTDPYVVVSWKWPDIIPWADFEIRSHIIWNEDVTYSYPVDIANTQSYRVEADTSFTIESWMFKNSPDPSGPIYVIDHSFSSMSEIESFSVMKGYETEDNTEVWLTSARPQIYQINPYLMYTTCASAGIPSSCSTPWTEFVLLGSMFDYVNHIFVSGTPGVFDMSWTPSTYLTSVSTPSGLMPVLATSGVNPYYFDFFSQISSLSAMYPPFSGISLSAGVDYTIDNKNQITFSLSAQGPGYFDVIALNRAGYGKLTKDTIRTSINPFPPSQPGYYTYVTWQPPYISGVEIRQ